MFLEVFSYGFSVRVVLLWFKAPYRIQMNNTSCIICPAKRQSGISNDMNYNHLCSTIKIEYQKNTTTSDR